MGGWIPMQPKKKKTGTQENRTEADQEGAEVTRQQPVALQETSRDKKGKCQ